MASGGATIIASLPFEESLTIIRTRGMVSVQLNSYASDLVPVGAIGMAVVSSEALVAGITAIPEPFNDADWGGWFVWRSFAYRFEFGDGTGSQLASWSMEIDSKAMRKVTPNTALVVIAESQATAFSVFDGTRHLFKMT